jgi:hypothetical protein
MPKTGRRFLVVARVGDRSLHRRWLSGGERNFDLYLSYYGAEPDKFAGDAEYWRGRKGPKWTILAEHVREDAAIIEAYQAIWLPDDDLLIDANQISRMFEYFSLFGMALGQPALSHDSYYSHSVLLHDSRYLVRYTNFVEVMAPILSRESMRVLSPTFNQSRIGWGLDYLWPYLLEKAAVTGRIGVIDAVTMVHTRPVGGGDLYKLDPSKSPEADVVSLRELYPEANINHKSQASKLSILGGVREETWEPGFMARIRAKIYRRIAHWKGRRSAKYKSQ